MANVFALIIGGSGEIGSEVARLFEVRGIKPVIIDKEAPENIKYPFIACDLTKPQNFENAIDKLMVISNGSVRYVVNAAGIFEAHNDGVFDRTRVVKVMDVNVIGTQSILALWFEKFGRKHGGVAVNISSAAGRRGTSDVAYGISKAALDSATRSLAHAWAPSKVWVIGIAPGLVKTKMAQSMTSERRQRLATNSLINRETTAREVADLVVSVTLSAPCLVTGTTIDASGGI